MDFTIRKYKELLQVLAAQGYAFQTFLRFIETDKVKRVVVLRHDVDRLPENALRLAHLEHDLGITGTYYFRVVPQSFDPVVIKEISGLGHEIGYHYEDLSMAARSMGVRNRDASSSSLPGDLLRRGITQFERNLEKLRELASVKTICMHGSPLSKWDNRRLWEKYDYRDYGIAGEPYLDVDYSRVLYINDTGRSWNRRDASIRDKVDSGFSMKIKSTPHLIRLAGAGRLPGQLMINTHPQRWHNPGIMWCKELVWQNTKNIGKYFLVRMSQ